VARVSNKDSSNNPTRPVIDAELPMAAEIDGDGGDDLQSRIEAQIADLEKKGPRIRTDPLIGTVLGGRFEMVSKIGAGGMGIVYKARQIGMDRWVAVKVLMKEYLTDETAVLRFKREALAVSRLEHPNTVRIFDFGESDTGMLYIAMEHLTGLPLDRILKNERELPIRRVLRIIQQMGRSLSEAHDKGIVHRDLKPDNVFVGEIEGQRDYVKVLDFGVAKLREHADGGTITQHGTIFGTPKYMSPEQCRSQEVDPRSDLYSLGVMMYELIAGRVPFESENPLAILIMHAQDEVMPMSEVRPNLVVPFEVEELLHRLLAKEAEHRPQDAKAVVDECERLLHQIPDMFESTITYDSAEEEGKPFDKSQAYTIRNAVNESILLRAESDEQQGRSTIAVEGLPLPASTVRRRGLALTAALLAAFVALGAWAWSQLQPLPDSTMHLIPEASAAWELPTLTPTLVAVTLSANVDNVNVLDQATGQVVGVLPTAREPVTFRWLKEQRTIQLALKYGDQPAQTRILELTEDTTVPPVVFSAATAGAETVRVDVTVDVGAAYISVSGMDQAWPSGAPGEARAIQIPRGDKPVQVTARRSGYLTASVAFVPSEAGALALALEPDPNAATGAPQIKLTLKTNVGKVDVRVESTGQLFRIAKTSDGLVIPLNHGEAAVELTFTRAGYNKATLRVVPNVDATHKVVLDRRKTSGTRVTGSGSNLKPGQQKTEPKVPKLTPIKKPAPAPKGVGRLNRLKGVD
jgi:serine/threonine protein kinase